MCISFYLLGTCVINLRKPCQECIVQNAPELLFIASASVNSFYTFLFVTTVYVWCEAVNLELSLCTMMHKVETAIQHLLYKDISHLLLWGNHFRLLSSIIKVSECYSSARSAYVK